MIGALAGDAIFCTAVFFETLAALSIIQAFYAIHLREEFEPIMAFYHAHAAPAIGFGASLVPARMPAWYADAYIISAVLFFAFFIMQARRAAAPYEDGLNPKTPAGDFSRVERLIDAALPLSVCVIGAFLCGLTLLPFLTLPVAVWLAAKRAFGAPSWFKISRAYYINIVAVIAGLGAVFAVSR